MEAANSNDFVVPCSSESLHLYHSLSPKKRLQFHCYELLLLQVRITLPQIFRTELLFYTYFTMNVDHKPGNMYLVFPELYIKMLKLLLQHLERDTTLYRDLCETFGECEECNKNNGSDDNGARDSSGKARARKRVDFLSKHRTKIVSDDLWFLHVTLQQVRTKITKT